MTWSFSDPGSADPRHSASSPKTSAATPQGLVGGGDAGVDRGLHQHLDELLAGQPDVQGAGEVGAQLLGLAERGELGDGDQAAVADGAGPAGDQIIPKAVSAT